MNKARLLFTAFATTGFSVSAWAQTAPVGNASTELELEEVVVTGTRLQATGFTAPTPVTVLDIQQI